MKLDFDQQKDKISEIIEKHKNSPLNMCSEFVDVLSNGDPKNESLLFNYICNHYEGIEVEEPNSEDKIQSSEETISKEDLVNFASKYKGYIDGIVRLSLVDAYQNQLDEVTFYDQLWLKVSKDIPQNPLNRALMLCILINNVHLPYYKMECGLKIDDDSFKNFGIKLLPVMKKIQFIYDLDIFSQRMEHMSVIFREINRDELHYDEKVYLFAFFYYLIEKKNKSNEM